MLGALREGVIERVFVSDGYGFIRPDGGGRDVFFHARERRKVVELSGRPDLAGPTPPSSPPAQGARVIFRAIPSDRPGGGMRASAWGLVDGGAASVEPNYATDPLDTLIERKSGGNMGATSLVQVVVRQMHELEFRAFCAITPDGEALWDAFKDWRRAQDHEDVEFLDFVRSEFARNQPNMIGPRRCTLEQPIRGFAVEAGLKGMEVTNVDLVRLFLEEPATMARLAPKTCHGCNAFECPNHARFGSERFARRTRR